MEKYEKIILAVKGSPLLKMIELGLKPEDIKEAVIKSLEPYFDNKGILEQFAIEVLVPESVNLLKLQKDKWFSEMFKKCLFTYSSAKSKDPQSCFKSCAQWQSYIIDSLSKYWSALHLETNKTALEIEEFLHECLRNIGEIIEGVTKPYLKVLLHQVRITNGIRTVLRDIDSLDLGTIINELIQKSGYADLFMPPPWNIRLNQWRNIAYHHHAKIENNEIVCWYGKTPGLKRIRLSRKELLEVVRTIVKLYGTLQLAHTLFFVDNLKEINKFSPPVEIRNEADFLNFAVGLASQGFEIIDYKKNTEEAKIVLIDRSNLNPDERRFHASQFLFPLWSITRSKKVIVEYREKDNTPNLLVSVNSKICEKIFNGELQPLTLAKKMGMIDLKTKKIIPPSDNDYRY